MRSLQTSDEYCLAQRRKGRQVVIRKLLGWGLNELGDPSTEFILSKAEGLRTCLARKYPNSYSSLRDLRGEIPELRFYDGT